MVAWDQVVTFKRAELDAVLADVRYAMQQVSPLANGGLKDVANRTSRAWDALERVEAVLQSQTVQE